MTAISFAFISAEYFVPKSHTHDFVDVCGQRDLGRAVHDARLSRMCNGWLTGEWAVG